MKTDKLSKKEKELLKELEIFPKSEVVVNPFSGVACTLEPTAVALYDFIKGCENLGNYTDFDLARELFIKLWPEEYSTLLD